MRRSERGVAAVEFALVLPLLALLVCGVIDLGRCFGAWNETRNAAREGAQYAQTFPNQQRPVAGGACATPNNIADRARQELPANASDSSFTVVVVPTVATCNPGGAGAVDPGDDITVTVTREVDLLTPLIRNLFGDVTVRSSVEVRVQG